jgi:hypothetical protein
MTIKYVTRIYEVNLPDDRTEVNRNIEAINHPEDAEIIKNSDEAVAVFMSYQYDAGHYQDSVAMYDTTVSDLIPDVEEFEVTEETE